MDPLKILKALSNPHRLDIILWLKHPEKEFGVQVHANTLIDFPRIWRMVQQRSIHPV